MNFPPFGPGDVTLPQAFAQASFESLGTAGAGFAGYKAQSATPATPASGFRIFADASGAPSVVSSTGVVTLLATATATAWIIPSTATDGLQIYNTTDQTTNYERLEFLWSTNIATIRTAKGGTGTQRNLDISAGGSFQLMLTGASSAGSMQFAAFQSTIVSAVGFNFNNSASNAQATSGTQTFLSLTPTYNQSSGTASNTDLLINRTETATGSGLQKFFDCQVSTVTKIVFYNTGHINTVAPINIGGSVATVGSAYLQINGAGFAANAWGLNGKILRVDASSWADNSTAVSGTVATAAFVTFAAPTLTAINASVTTTFAATMYIADAPTQGSNQTITAKAALWIAAGGLRLDGTTGAGAQLGTLTNAPKAGNPTNWIPIMSNNGTQLWFPAWSL